MSAAVVGRVEPGRYTLVDEFDAVRAPIRALVEEAGEAGGPSAAVERFCTLFEVELGTDELCLPDEETLASLSAPVSLLVSEDGPPFFAEIAGRLGERLRRRRRHHARSTRRVSRPTLRVRRGHAAVPPRASGAKPYLPSVAPRHCRQTDDPPLKKESRVRLLRQPKPPTRREFSDSIRRPRPVRRCQKAPKTSRCVCRNFGLSRGLVSCVRRRRVRRVRARDGDRRRTGLPSRGAHRIHSRAHT